ncbi:Os05g0349600 [Oryza sativa Japonica Group]|uniref:Os05g0349600 protein n=1 Tax=Oryza sativa subsp. japonica TaxID=39947 RepID=A0A0P0WL13_ORYSJ|nr:hypothetical protein EE612_028839 [Oryza sativa]BAS93525.1 Os05g0349600 [Oryza sativa Japonica Group]
MTRRDLSPPDTGMFNFSSPFPLSFQPPSKYSYNAESAVNMAFSFSSPVSTGPSGIANFLGASAEVASAGEELPLFEAPILKDGNDEPSVFSPNRGALELSLEPDPNENEEPENPVPASPVKAFWPLDRFLKEKRGVGDDDCPLLSASFCSSDDPSFVSDSSPSFFSSSPLLILSSAPASFAPSSSSASPSFAVLSSISDALLLSSLASPATTDPPPKSFASSVVSTG